MSALTDPPADRRKARNEVVVNLAFLLCLGGGLALTTYRLNWSQEGIPGLCEVIVGGYTYRINRHVSHAWLRRIIALPWYAVDFWFLVELDWHRVWWCLVAILVGFLIALPAYFRKQARLRAERHDLETPSATPG